MKLNWFSPLPPAETEIASYTRGLLPELSKRAEVVLWTDQREWDTDLEDYARVRSYEWDSIPWSEVNKADMTLYNLGNNPIFHEAIWQVSIRHPGIVILHDLFLHDLFFRLYTGTSAQPSAYVNVMESYYGEAGRSHAVRFLDYKDDPGGMSARYPLTSHGLLNSLGALVHSRGAYDFLADEYPRPTAYTPLPHYSAFAQACTGDQRSNEPPYRLVAFGYLGKNRRLEEVLTALAEFPDREKFRLDIYGRLEERQSVLMQIQTLNLDELVAVHGFVPDAELDEVLSSAHLAVNLRYPSMGEASGAQLRIWAQGLPSLVTRTGWYATIPEDAVAFVTPDDEVKDIQAHLEAFLSDPARFAEMGKRGREILEEHDPTKCADFILEFINSVITYRPVAAIYGLTERVKDELEAWMSPACIKPTAVSAARKIYELANGRES